MACSTSIRLLIPNCIGSSLPLGCPLAVLTSHLQSSFPGVAAPARPSPLLPQTSGNDVFYRNPFNVEENLFVNVSSPSSSKFQSVSDLGSPEEAARKTQEQARG